MLQSQYWTREQIDAFQNERLRALIEYAYNNVPFYHDVMSERGLTPADIQTKADLHKLPIINKEIIRKEGLERFTSRTMPQKQMLRLGSSGSTGQPFYHYMSRRSYSVNMAVHLRGWYSMGWRLGDRYVKMSHNLRSTRMKRMQDILTHNMCISTSDLSDEHIYEILSKLESYKPVVIRSYPDTLFIIAKYRLEHCKEFSYHPMAITTTGNVLHSQMRDTIEKAFGCKIYDSYGCEGNSSVFECTTHDCYHVSEEYNITEVLDDQDNPIQSGIGRVISTDLWNYATVFIRYDVQDRVELYGRPCSCGREHMTIKRIIGRENELLISPMGKKYTGHHFTIFCNPTNSPQLNDSIEQFQIVQHADKSITFRFVVNARYNCEVEQYVVDYWRKELGVPVDVQIVERMPILQNDKRRVIVIE